MQKTQVVYNEPMKELCLNSVQYKSVSIQISSSKDTNFY